MKHIEIIIKAQLVLDSFVIMFFQINKKMYTSNELCTDVSMDVIITSTRIQKVKSLSVSVCTKVTVE